MKRLALIVICCRVALSSRTFTRKPTTRGDLKKGTRRSRTWQQLVTDSALDLGLFTAFTALALISFFRKSVGLKT